MKEIFDINHKMTEDYFKLERLIPKRIGELYEISKQKGINNFGWKGGWPKEDDFDDPEEYEAVREEFLGYEFFITTYDDYISKEYAAYRFKFDDCGELVITEYYDYRVDKYVDNYEIRFSYTDWKNIPCLVSIIAMIEQELGL